MKTVVVTGDPGAGFLVYGPFEDGSEAAEWAGLELGRTGGWWVMGLLDPNR